ncbi:KamA family radical SAM protein [Streptosporangium roseum]|uniref:L-lysine 2,3-aminomutase n=1 Tax=Streptosporangium roseum (strain ATCC 12428 / DSM 43021 / JCM 3005 / KCTC 9067 / NCIMB 10171 / NRRL 2505 / NI 9100) TaxID=479432 RepID=D2B7Q1_STRRD|nr:lysine 2,3-aminomutase [Streptosporangium roseum]ACZ91572.1 L-lysine 2,3-aminomutase [Streptosporangium roseum DSM 43021]
MILKEGSARGFRAYTAKHLDDLLLRAGLGDEERLRIRAVATVLPFRTNAYVVDQLIDWSAIPDDPIYRLVFPQADMLPEPDVTRLAGLLRAGAPNAEIQAAAREVRMRLNPHPAGQLDLNVPRVGEDPMPGMQHKYPETVLFFPKQGQTCHAYCTYCFRWAQFIGEPDLKFASDDVDNLVGYLKKHPRVTSVLFTGGDPMIMSESVLRRYLEPLLELEQLESIRIGTKSLAYWPQRFVSDPDAADTLRLFASVVDAGKNLAFMAHFSHPREMESPVAEAAVAGILATGAVIRTQAPLIRTINDDPATWSSMWRRQLTMGMVPYYMFVERDTGPQDYFAVPLARAHEIFRDAYASVSGLCRTVRGPSMSATPGKVCVDGVAEIAGQKVFVLHLIQARDPELVGRPFFARYDPTAAWLTDLRPAFADRFPFESSELPELPELPELLGPSDPFEPATVPQRLSA